MEPTNEYGGASPTHRVTPPTGTARCRGGHSGTKPDPYTRPAAPREWSGRRAARGEEPRESWPPCPPASRTPKSDAAHLPHAAPRSSSSPSGSPPCTSQQSGGSSPAVDLFIDDIRAQAYTAGRPLLAVRGGEQRDPPCTRRENRRLVHGDRTRRWRHWPAVLLTLAIAALFRVVVRPAPAPGRREPRRPRPRALLGAVRRIGRAHLRLVPASPDNNAAARPGGAGHQPDRRARPHRPTVAVAARRGVPRRCPDLLGTRPRRALRGPGRPARGCTGPRRGRGRPRAGGARRSDPGPTRPAQPGLPRRVRLGHLRQGRGGEAGPARRRGEGRPVAARRPAALVHRRPGGVAHRQRPLLVRLQPPAAGRRRGRAARAAARPRRADPGKPARGRSGRPGERGLRGAGSRP